MQKHLPKDLYREEIKLTAGDILDAQRTREGPGIPFSPQEPPCPVAWAVVRQVLNGDHYAKAILVEKSSEEIRLAYPDAQYVLWIGDAPWLISEAGEEACAEWDEGNLPKPCTFEIGEVPDGR